MDDWLRQRARLDDWFRHHALHNPKSGASRTYVVCPAGSRQIIGYYALSMGQILAHENVGSIRGNVPCAIPVVVLGRLAIDLTWQGRGLGRAMLANVVRRSRRAAVEVAARLVIVHAISPTAEAFYHHHGFTRLPLGAPILGINIMKFQ
ncbi:MAG: GNAT family N-acetyltransferase [Acidocella sp.]|nr:GNAT family N-acetyltransferase [Acidocella sp.]